MTKPAYKEISLCSPPAVLCWQPANNHRRPGDNGKDQHWPGVLCYLVPGEQFPEGLRASQYTHSYRRSSWVAKLITPAVQLTSSLFRSRPWVLCHHWFLDYRRVWSVAFWGSFLSSPPSPELHVELYSQRLQYWVVSNSLALDCAVFTLVHSYRICTVQCKVKLWAPCSKIKNFKSTNKALKQI